jgi:hypothetical protein
MIGHLRDDHPAGRVADQHDGLPHRIEDPSQMVCVGSKITELRGVAASGTGHLLDHVDAMAVLLEQRGGLTPVPAADEPAVNEHVVGHRASVTAVTTGNNRLNGPRQRGVAEHVEGPSMGEGLRAARPALPPRRSAVHRWRDEPEHARRP